MKEESVRLRVEGQVIEISGGEAIIYENNRRVFFSYQGNEIPVTQNMIIETMGDRSQDIRIIHHTSDECIEIQNNSKNVKVTHMNKIAEPTRTIRLDTHDLERYGDNAPIKFSDTRGTRGGFRIHPLKPSETQGDSNDKDDSLTNGELKSPYDSDQDNSEEKSHKDIEELLASSNYATEVTYGGQRTVYRVDASTVDMLEENDGSIVKVAHNQKGVQANRHEAQTWQAVKKSNYRKFFCPITSIGPSHKYVVMEEADMDGISHMGTGEFRKEVTSTLEIPDDVDSVSPMGDGWDIFSANVGMYDGRPVLVDYPYGGNIIPDF